MQGGRVETWKGFPVVTSVPGPWGGGGGGAWHIFMRMHPFPCESISKVGDHYQHNGLADGCSCCTRLLALEDHSRWPRSEGGWCRVTGQDRAAGGCMRCWLVHTGIFQITISIYIYCNVAIITRGWCFALTWRSDVVFGVIINQLEEMQLNSCITAQTF